MRLADKVALITGAGRGIGEAIAVAFAREGARLALASRTGTELESVAARCRQAGAEALVIPTDVSDRAAVGRLVDATLVAYNQVDVLVNAAGTSGPIGPLAQLSESEMDEWESSTRIMLFGTLFCCWRVLPIMVHQGRGKIINFSGGGATAPLPNLSAYASAKAAVVRLTETLAEENKAHNIQVNAIAPGQVDTGLQDRLLAAGDTGGKELVARIRKMRETGEGGVPPELAAQLAVFLASDESTPLTGKLIAAPYDPWQEWSGRRAAELNASPMYTLRRLDPFTLRPLIDQLR